MNGHRNEKSRLRTAIAFYQRHRRRVLRAGLATTLILALGVPALWLGALGGGARVVAWADRAFEHASLSTGLVLREIRLSGRQNAERPALMTAIGIPRDAPILAVDLPRLRERIENLGWIAEARVARRLPNIIEIDIVERTPFARWQNEGRLFLIDREGAVITAHDVQAYDALPLVVGSDAPDSAAALVDMLASDPALRERVTAAIRVGGRRWNLQLDNGAEVLLPEDDAPSAWRRLGAMQREQNILERDVTVIDLRLADRVFLRLPPETAAGLRDPGEST